MRWLNCPGSFRLSQQAPPSRSSVYAATGTLAHEAIERSIKRVLAETGNLEALRTLDLDNMLGSQFPVDGHDIVIDQDFLDGVHVMLHYVADQVPNYDLMRCELTVRLDSYFRNRPPPPVKLFGRTDVVLLRADMLEIVDYKNGSGILVDPNDNPQMLYYAAGVLAAVTKLQNPVLIETVRMTVVQPHARSVDKVRSADIDVLDLQMWIDDVLIPGVDACGRSDAPLVPGSWCRFCPVSFACPALIEEAVRMAKIEFDDQQILFTDPDELSRHLDIAERAQAWIDAIRGYALERLQRQERIPNWGLVPTRPTRRWTNIVDVQDACIDVLHLDRADMMRDPEIKSPAQLEKLVRRRLSARAWEQTLSPLVESHSSGVKLHRENDPLEAFDDTS
jgi:hypothetical protein